MTVTHTNFLRHNKNSSLSRAQAKVDIKDMEWYCSRMGSKGSLHNTIITSDFCPISLEKPYLFWKPAVFEMIRMDLGISHTHC